VTGQLKYKEAIAMLKHMLSGTAVALLIAANPALAQTTGQYEVPQAQEETEATEGLDEFETDTGAAQIEESSIRKPRRLSSMPKPTIWSPRPSARPRPTSPCRRRTTFWPAS
jgi:hypothetical protein